MKKYDLLLEYFIRERDRLSAEIVQLQENIRYRRISSVDCLELIIAQERLSAFLDFSDNVKALLRIRYYDREVFYDEDTEKEG